MSRLKDNLSIHWPLLLGLALLMPAAWMYIAMQDWEARISSAAIAVLGFVCTAFPDEVSSWTGRYGWTYESFWTYPSTYVRFCGILTQVLVLVLGFAS